MHQKITYLHYSWVRSNGCQKFVSSLYLANVPETRRVCGATFIIIITYFRNFKGYLNTTGKLSDYNIIIFSAFVPVVCSCYDVWVEIPLVNVKFMIMLAIKVYLVSCTYTQDRVWPSIKMPLTYNGGSVGSYIRCLPHHCVHCSRYLFCLSFKHLPLPLTFLFIQCKYLHNIKMDSAAAPSMVTSLNEKVATFNRLIWFSKYLL